MPKTTALLDTSIQLDPVPALPKKFRQTKSHWDKRAWQVLVYHFLGKQTFDIFRRKKYLTQGGHDEELYPFLIKAWSAFVRVFSHPSNHVITKALSRIKFPYDTEALTHKIAQTFEAVIVPAGWDEHAMTVVFWKKYLVLCNRGQPCAEQTKYLTYYRVDRSKITVNLVKQIIKGYKQPNQVQGQFLYVTLPKVLGATRDRFCRHLERMQPSRQKNNNCVIASLKQAVRVLLLCSGSKRNIEEHQNHYKSFAVFARLYILDLYDKQFHV